MMIQVSLEQARRLAVISTTKAKGVSDMQQITYHLVIQLI
jgi:hypothetical protein